MKEKILFLALCLFFISYQSFSQTHLPAAIDSKLNECFSKKLCPNDLNFKIMNEWFLPAEEGKTYGVFSFSFSKIEPKDKDKQENVLMPPPSYHFYLRILKQVENNLQIIQEYNSPVPEQEAQNAFFLFAFPLLPDKYIFEIALSTADFSQNSITIIHKDFPSLPQSNKITYSTPIFVREMRKLEQIDTIFTIWRNCFHYGAAEIYPYFENSFEASEKPTLLIMRIFGLQQDKESLAYKFEYTITIKKDDKDIIKFKPMTAPAPGIFQPLIFLKDNKEIDKGNYILDLKIKDLISGKETDTSINFSIK